MKSEGTLDLASSPKIYNKINLELRYSIGLNGKGRCGSPGAQCTSIMGSQCFADSLRTAKHIRSDLACIAGHGLDQET